MRCRTAHRTLSTAVLRVRAFILVRLELVASSVKSVRFVPGQTATLIRPKSFSSSIVNLIAEILTLGMQADSAFGAKEELGGWTRLI